MDEQQARRLCKFAVVNGAFVVTAVGSGWFGLKLLGQERLASTWPFFTFLAVALVLGLGGAFLANRIFLPEPGKGKM